jgi:hypothetical protein
MESIENVLTRAQATFEAHDAPWTDRTAPALTNVLTPPYMLIEERTLAPHVVRTLLRALIIAGKDKLHGSTEARAALHAIYGEDGTPHV